MRARLKDVLNVQVPVLIESELKMQIPQGLQCKVSRLLSDRRSAGRTFLHATCSNVTLTGTKVHHLKKYINLHVFCCSWHPSV